MTNDNRTTGETLESIAGVLGLSLDESLVESGGYGTGFFKNRLMVDLEHLRDGELDDAFSVLTDVHDTAGISFREMYGISVVTLLPDGVKGSAIAQMCLDLWERREDLTEGFYVQWDGRNYVGKWESVATSLADLEDGDVNPKALYWGERFQEEVRELDAFIHYGLDEGDNFDFVYDEIKADIAGLQEVTAEKIEAILRAHYEDDCDYVYSGYGDAAQYALGRWIDTADEYLSGD